MPRLFALALILILISCHNKDSAPAYQNPLVAPFTEAIQAEPNNPEWYFKRAEALQQVNADSLAAIDLEHAVKLNPSNPKYQLSLGLCYLNQGNHKSAISAFQEFSVLMPNDLRGRLLLSKAYLEDGQIAKAKAEVEKVLSLAPEYPDAHYWHAQVKLKENDTTAAMQILKDVLSADTDYYLASYLLADLYAAARRDDAIGLYRRTFEMDTANLDPLFDLSGYYLRKNRDQDAKTVLKETILRDPDYSAAYVEMGKILLAEDSIDKALRQFKIAVKTKPDEAEAYHYQGVCFDKLGQQDSARAAYHQAKVFGYPNTK